MNPSVQETLAACQKAMLAGAWQQAEALARKAFAQEQDDPQVALTLVGCALRDPVRLEEAHRLVAAHWPQILERRDLARMAWETLMRACDHDRLAQLSPILSLYDEVDPQIAPFMPVPLRRLSADRAEYDALTGFQARWAAQAMAQAQADPLPPSPPVVKQRPRIGLLSEKWLPMIVQALDPVVDGLRRHFDLFGYCARQDDRPGQPGPTGKFLRRLHKLTVNAHRRDLALAIQQDGIDVLIDLNALQQSGSLSAVMAWRPAPVQLIWLARPSPLPLPVIDGQILDPHLIAQQPWQAEPAWLLPEAWACFGRPPSLTIDPEPPSRRNGFVTFGTMQPPEYLRAETLGVWARILHSQQDSHFIMIRPECASPVVGRHLTAAFARHGIAAERLRFLSNRPGMHHLAGYGDIDIALDAIPISAGMVTLEALWMGVPVISWAGPQPMHRLGVSFLANAKAADLAVSDADAYVATAVALAADSARRAVLRTSLRSALSASPVCDSGKFIQGLLPLLHDLSAKAGENRR